MSGGVVSAGNSGGGTSATSIGFVTVSLTIRSRSPLAPRLVPCGFVTLSGIVAVVHKKLCMCGAQLCDDST